MSNRYIPAEDSLVRYVSYQRLRRLGVTDQVVGVLPQAFELRDGEEYLSATWVEFFGPQGPSNLRTAIYAIRNSLLKPTKKSGFAIGEVSSIAATAKSLGISLRIIHESAADNIAHTAIRRWPRDNEDLFELMASETWCNLVLNSQVR